MVKKYISLLIIICFIAAYNLSGSTAEQVEQASTFDELELLLTAADSLMEHEIGITIHYSSLFSPEEPYDSVQTLGNHLLLQLSFPDNVQLHSTVPSQPYIVSASEDYIQYSLRVHRIEEHDAYHLSVLLETNSLQHSLHTLEEQLHQLDASLIRLGLENSVNILIQGSPLQQYIHDLESWQSHAEQALKSQYIEGYQDHSSMIDSYYSPLLTRSIQTGQQEMNIQAKLHQHTVTQQWQVSIGYPIIVTE